MQLLQKVQGNDLPQCHDFAIHILSWIAHDDDYLSKVCFIDEATFQVSGKVNHRNCHIWGSQNSRDVRKHEQDSLKWNVWCGLTNAGVIGPFFFHEKTVTGAVYLDMLENYAMPQIPHGYHLPARWGTTMDTGY